MTWKGSLIAFPVIVLAWAGLFRGSEQGKVVEFGWTASVTRSVFVEGSSTWEASPPVTRIGRDRTLKWPIVAAANWNKHGEMPCAEALFVLPRKKNTEQKYVTDCDYFYWVVFESGGEQFTYRTDSLAQWYSMSVGDRVSIRIDQNGNVSVK